MPTGPRMAMAPSPIYYIQSFTDINTRFSAPANVSLEELRKVELGYGIRATISQRPG